MTIIISGRFQQQAMARQAVADLVGAGFAAERTATFYVNPAGQHDLAPTPGAYHESPGSDEAAHGAAVGAAAGGAVGVAVGLAGLPLLGTSVSIATAGLGAYVGSLFGALETMKDEDSASSGTASDDIQLHAPVRKAGLLVAVSTPAAREQETAIRILRALGATDIERPEGRIHAGQWTDFNPSTPLQLVAGVA